MAAEKNKNRLAILSESIIKIKNLNFSYEEKNSVIFGVDLTIYKDLFTVILGQNGSGKSTLLKCMSGILSYHSGSIAIKGKELKNLSVKERAKLIGYLPQQHKPVFPFSVFEVVLTGRVSYIRQVPSKHDEAEANKAIHTVGIEHLKDRIYSELSGGEQQLVMIARILAQKPEILLLDEPISHLDYNNQIMVISMLKKLVARGMTVIAVLHDPNMAFLCGDEFIYVHRSVVHKVNEKKPWQHPLTAEIFHNNIQFLEHSDTCVFIPQFS
jgi:iron complex transport system ATP-binding protein